MTWNNLICIRESTFRYEHSKSLLKFFACIYKSYWNFSNLTYNKKIDGKNLISSVYLNPYSTRIFSTNHNRWIGIANGNQVPKYSTVAKWAAHFKEGRERLEDDPRSRRPQTTYTAENIERVRAINEEDPHAKHNIIKAVTSINHFTINQIICNAA